MTTTKKPAPRSQAKKIPAPGADDAQAADLQEPVLPSPAVLAGFAAAAQALRDAARTWHSTQGDPRRDVHNARKAFRIQHEAWPTTLTVSALVFDDICNDLNVAAYIAGIPQRNVYDRVDSYHALLYLAPYFGVQRVELDPEEQAASVSSPPAS